MLVSGSLMRNTKDLSCQSRCCSSVFLLDPWASGSLFLTKMLASKGRWPLYRASYDFRLSLIPHPDDPAAIVQMKLDQPRPERLGRWVPRWLVVIQLE
jgi:hypothetical protein